LALLHDPTLERQSLHDLAIQTVESSKVVNYREPKRTALDAVRYGSPVRDTESAAISSISRGGRVLGSSSTPNWLATRAPGFGSS
jgi:hypothetical protein